MPEGISPDSDPLLTETEVAEYYRCSRALLRAQRSEGRGIPYVRLAGGRSIRYLWSDVLAAVEVVNPASSGPATANDAALIMKLKIKRQAYHTLLEHSFQPIQVQNKNNIIVSNIYSRN